MKLLVIVNLLITINFYGQEIKDGKYLLAVKGRVFRKSKYVAPPLLESTDSLQDILESTNDKTNYMIFSSTDGVKVERSFVYENLAVKVCSKSNTHKFSFIRPDGVVGAFNLEVIGSYINKLIPLQQFGGEGSLKIQGVILSQGHAFGFMEHVCKTIKDSRDGFWELKPINTNAPKIFIEQVLNNKLTCHSNDWCIVSLGMNFKKIKNNNGNNCFFMAETEVTQEQYWKVIGSWPSEFSFKGNNRPVENISFTDAENFCNILNQWSSKNNILPFGFEFRLPTQKEYLTVLGEKSPIFDKKLLNTVWLGESTAGLPQPVASLPPNQFGIYDILGNVTEYGYVNKGRTLKKTSSGYLGGYDLSLESMRLFWGSDISDAVLTEKERGAIKNTKLTSFLDERDLTTSLQVGFRICIGKKLEKTVAGSGSLNEVE